MDLKVKYLGLELDNPIIIASSPFTMTVDKIKRLEESGAGAVVLKSVFEEQVMGEAAFLERFHEYPEAADYLNNYLEDDYINNHLKLIQDAKKTVNIPIIASINCSQYGSWIEYAKSIEAAGADAIELNMYILPDDSKQKAKDIEDRYMKVIGKVVDKVRIPVSVKLGMRFTNILSFCRDIYFRRGRGVVMFNRFAEPDFDINNISFVSGSSISSHEELRNNLRTIGLCAPQLPMLDIAASTGVHTGEDVVKSLLAGAKAVQICSALYLHGLPIIEQMKEFVANWMEEHNFRSVQEFNGLLAYDPKMNSDIYQRAQYMKFFQTQKEPINS